jgi:hypothetical protein
MLKHTNRVVAFYLVLLVCYCSSCNNKPIKHNNNSRVLIDSVDALSNFQVFLSAIDDISLPLSFYCGIDGITSIEEYDANVICKFVPDRDDRIGIAGKLPSKKGKEFIIYGVTGDIIYPYLFVYDKNGNRLDSLYLHISYCLGDESVIISNYTTINKDYSVLMTDTTKYIHFNNDNDTIFIDSILVKSRRMAMNKNYKYTVKEDNQYKLDKISISKVPF